MNSRFGGRRVVLVCPGLCLGLVTLSLATQVLLPPAPAAAQVEARWFPDIQPFRTLIAAPREVPVSYTHLTLPTTYPVLISMVAVSI